ncbi:MAG TPA: hypothetical protein PLV92_21220, partial [Pirellulaceae bacterium]|nr:hypothetical protein [Pirellulaceae bacterium]
PTNINAGTLVLTGSIAAGSTTTVSSGATLQGTGTTGPLTVNAGATLEPGVGSSTPGSIGVLTVVGNLFLGGTLRAEVATAASGPGSGYDQVKVIGGGSVTIASSAVLTNPVPFNGTPGSFTPATLQTLKLIDNDGAGPGDTSGSFGGMPIGSTLTVDGRTFKLYYGGGDGNDLVLVNTAGTPATLYVNDQFTSTAMVDGDLEASNLQESYVGINAFASIAAALSQFANFGGTIVVNGGAYDPVALAGGGSVTLELVRDLVNGQNDATLRNISGDASDSIVTRARATSGGNLVLESGTFSGVISGDGSVTKNGTGTLSLLGSNTFTGTTTLTAGALSLDGALIDGSSATDLTVGASSTLAGTGDVNGAVTVSAGGRIEPGAPNLAGVLELGDGTTAVTFFASSTYAVQLGGTTPGDGLAFHDQITAKGVVNLGGATLSVALINGLVLDSQFSQSFLIIDNDGVEPVVGTFAGRPEGSRFSVPGTTTQLYVTYRGGDGNDVVLATNPVITGSDGVNDSIVVRLTANHLNVEASVNGAAFVDYGAIADMTLIS